MCALEQEIHRSLSENVPDKYSVCVQLISSSRFPFFRSGLWSALRIGAMRGADCLTLFSLSIQSELA